MFTRPTFSGCLCHNMEAHKSLLICALICTVTGVFSQGLRSYVKTDGSLILSLVKRTYSVRSATECAAKCDAETTFICRSFVYIEEDHDCLTIPANSKVRPLYRRGSAKLYEKKEYLKECVSGIGADYRGTKSITKSGIICQQWTSRSPHKPNMNSQRYPKADLESNFCRNPDSDAGGPWCYTMDPAKRWESCDVQDCASTDSSEDCMHCSGEDYRGNISRTEAGYTCQHWDAQTPHSHGYMSSLLPDKHLEENYCRNPDGEPKPWCFTTAPQKRWDFCNIPQCASDPPATEEEYTCITGDGTAYRGSVSVTVTGRACQTWSSQTPHKHSQRPENYPCKTLEENYCRNPNSEKSPWCYTSDPGTRWEYCRVPRCGEEEPVVPETVDCHTGDGSSYRGAMSETVSGKTCQAWSSMAPHRHQTTPQAFPQADLQGNLCRNPDGDRAPWCFTTDPGQRWDYCKLGKCPTTRLSPVSRAEKPTDPAVTLALPTKDCKVGNGVDYRGLTSTTLMGVTCQAWSSMEPHPHAAFTSETHPEKGLAGNQCRNPDNDVNGPWCYTMDEKKKWDYCQIPDCSEHKCGEAKVTQKRCFGRIVGECVSEPHSWPWQISLRTRTGVHNCGGTLIGAQWVLTAAHCINRGGNPSAYRVFLGIHSEKATEPSKQMRDVEKLILEPTGKDIALLKLDKPAILNDKVSPACLPEKDYIVPPNTACYITGWGDTQGTGGEGFLKETGFPIIENTLCNAPLYLDGRVKDHEMCAGNIEGGTDSCKGDSGGPLVCVRETAFIIQGVTSWGLGCARVMSPGVYVRVSKFVDWIRREMLINK